MAKKNTRLHILDCAEELFAERGIAEVSLRDIISKAEVNLAAVHYHFGSRDDLIREVFRRRLKEVNTQRLSELEKLREEYSPEVIPTQKLLRAFLAAPFLMGKRDSGGANFFRIIARAHAETNEVVSEELLFQLKDVIQEFLKEFKKSAPAEDDTEQLMRLVFSAGAMVQAVLAPMKEQFIKALADTDFDNEKMLEMLIRFCAAGMEADGK